MSLNQFSDMTFEEFRKFFLLTVPQVRYILQYILFYAAGAFSIYLCLSFTFPLPSYVSGVLKNCSATKGNHVSRSGPYPDFVDWRKKGNFVTPVKNQVSIFFNKQIQKCHNLVRELG